MSCLVIGCDALFLVRDDTALLLSSDTNLDEGFSDIILCDIFSVFARCTDCCLIHQILKVCTCESCCSLCNLL